MKASLRETFDGDPWHGPSVQAALEGITARRASLRPVAGAHTIWEIVVHMEAWVQVVRRRLQGEPGRDVPPAEDWPSTGSTEDAWHELLASLEASLRDLERALDTAVWTPRAEVPGCGYTFEFMLEGLIHHNLYHAGQIAMLKKADADGGGGA